MDKGKLVVLTYGTYDLLHIGHVNLLRRARQLGDYLIVGLSTDRFNTIDKHKATVQCYDERRVILQAIRYVDEVFPEDAWTQKPEDIARTGAGIFVMGSDWEGRFDHLSAFCQVVYLPRTEGISTSDRKRDIVHRFDADGSEVKSDEV